MQKRINRQIENIMRVTQHNYRSEDTVFIDVDVIRAVKRKAIQMKSKLSTHFMGMHYQACLEELGLWNVGKEDS